MNVLQITAGETNDASTAAPTPSTVMYRISWRDRGQDFVAGILVRDGKVVRAAPILKWTSGKSWFEVKGYFHQREWKVEQLKDT